VVIATCPSSKRYQRFGPTVCVVFPYKSYLPNTDHEQSSMSICAISGPLDTPQVFIMSTDRCENLMCHGSLNPTDLRNFCWVLKYISFHFISFYIYMFCLSSCETSVFLWSRLAVCNIPDGEVICLIGLPVARGKMKRWRCNMTEERPQAMRIRTHRCGWLRC
jgi:hypothetical protein